MPRGPAPKPAELRQRRNRESTHSQLPTASAALQNDVPELPPRIGDDWHPNVKEWWRSVWQSPMASEYQQADVNGGLNLLADLYQIRYTGTAKEIISVTPLIMRQEVRFGLSPIDRRRLQWQIPREEAPAVVEKPVCRPQRPTKDPRSAVRLEA